MLRIIVANDVEPVQAVRTLWNEYWKELGLSNEFQGFAKEVQTLPGIYVAPAGTLAIAYAEGSAAGTVALRPLERDSCEVKRLYVRPQFRRKRVGLRLMEWVIEQARLLGYRKVHGDTLPTMVAALRMYHELGFRVMDHPYSNDPTPGAIYLELLL